MKELTAKLVTVHAGDNEDLSKEAHKSVEIEPDGFVGDKHRGFTRIAASWDPEPNGTIRRNERQWSGVSLEEIGPAAGGDCDYWGYWSGGGVGQARKTDRRGPDRVAQPDRGRRRTYIADEVSLAE